MAQYHRGSTVALSQIFPNTVGTPTVAVRDYNGNLIASPTATVDISNPLKYNISFVIPNQSPVCTQPGQLYTTTWTATASGTSTNYVMQQDFVVIQYSEIETAEALAALGVYNDSITDSIIIPTTPDSNSIKWSLVSLTSAPLATYQFTTVVASPPYVMSPLSTPDAILLSSSTDSNVVIQVTSLNSGANLINLSCPIDTTIPSTEYMSVWSWTVGGIKDSSYRQAFVITPRVASFISQLRMFLDRAQILKYDGYSLFQDVELADCLWRALDRYNSTSPQITAYNLDSMPNILDYLILKTAQYEAVSRWYLSEGMMSFNFQGGSITLDVDRTQYLQQVQSELGQFVQNDLPRSKSTISKTMSPGQLAINLGPSNNYLGNATPNALYSLKRVSLR